MRPFTLHLVDNNAEVADALSRYFRRFAEVTIEEGDITALGHGAVVSPANSQGFMDGGVDRIYARFFGAPLTRAVREAALAQPEGQLPIGVAIAVPTGHARIPYLIVSPTMISPEHVPAANAYRAMRAALKLMDKSPELGDALFCPGLATLVGGVAPDDAAREMSEAYADWRESRA